MNRGEVYRFNYLWGHEAERGRTGSRKIRKVCLVMQVGEWLYLFPFTSLEPKPVEGRRAQSALSAPHCAALPRCRGGAAAPARRDPRLRPKKETASTFSIRDRDVDGGFHKK